MASDLRRRYRERKSIASGLRTSTHFAQAEDGRKVVIKTYSGQLSSEGRARHEAAALSACEHPRIPKIVELAIEEESASLVLEAIPGVPLQSMWARGDCIEIDRALSIGISCAEILTDLHAAHVVHRGVHPANVLVEPEFGESSLVGFSLARPVGKLRDQQESAEGSGEPAYMAPEQTGRMNRGCDARSDLYGLGGTLYFALTGRPPFEGSDPLALIHAHMALRPTPVHELRADVPHAVSRLIGKLLAKQPEERYQSADALRHDLIELRARLRSGSLDEGFALGRTDGAERPRFTRTLRGREAEQETLEREYARAARGALAVVWLAGPPGAGKSALIDVLRPLVSGNKGYLAEGKFDLYNDRPYAGWVAVLSSLAEQILLESDADLAEWRQTLLAALGPIAGVLVDLAPDLHHVFGDVPAVAPAGPRQTRERLALALERFVLAMATPAHPLVLFLDDLQWSDSGSRFLLEYLLTLQDQPALLITGTYRDDALVPGSPWPSLLDRLESRGLQSRVITLGPLSPEATEAMLAEALGHPREAIGLLAEQVARKTGNLPLLIREFTEHLSDRGLLRYTTDTGFTWDISAITEASIPDGAVQLMQAKIASLPQRVRRVLEAASCVGDHVDAKLLAELCREPIEDLESALYALANAGLMMPSPAGFRFAHDRLREAAQSGQSEQARAELHAEMAEILLSHVPREHWEARAFEIADHLNHGRSALHRTQVEPLIELNLLAGRKALAAGSAVEATQYFANAWGEFSEEFLPGRYALAFALLLGLSQSKLLTGDLAGAECVLAELETHPLSRSERTQVAEMRLRIWSLTKTPPECAVYELDVLRTLGVRWPIHASRRYAARKLKGTLRSLNAVSEDELFERISQPAATDAAWLDALRLVDGAAACLARTNSYLGMLAASMILAHSLEWGYVTSPSYTLANFALYSHAVFFDGALLARFYRYACTALEHERDPLFAARTRFILVLLNGWQMHRRQAVASLPAIRKELLEAGDLEFAYFAGFQNVLIRVLCGDPIQEVSRDLRAQIDRVRRFGHSFVSPEGALTPYRLLSEVEPKSLDLDAEIRANERWLAENGSGFETVNRSVWMMVLCIFGRDDLAHAQAAALHPDPMRILPFPYVLDRILYEGIAAARLALRAKGFAAFRLRRIAKRACAQLRRFRAYAPDVSPMLELLDAERMASTTRAPAALALYERAAKTARSANHPHLAAIAHEHRADLLRRLNRPAQANAARAQAAALYAEWGATTKARFLAADAIKR